MNVIDTVVQQLKSEHASLMKQAGAISAALAAFGATYKKKATRLSPEARDRIAAAQRARWAKIKGQSPKSTKVASMPKKRTISAAARKKIAASQRARWAKLRAKKKSA